MNIFFRTLTGASALALIALPINAAPPRAGVNIEGPWSRETAPGAKIGAGYLHIVNRGKVADRLMVASSPVSGKVEIHTMSMDGGVMRMRPLPNGIAIPANGSATLKPGGNHIMFIGLKKPLKRGGTFPVTLRFEKAGLVTANFTIMPVAATGPGGDQ